LAIVEELKQTIKALETKVQVLEDVIAIDKLKSRYAQIADSRQFAKGDADREAIATAMADLFTEDGIWDGGELFGTHRGRQAIHDYFYKPGWKLALHYVMNSHIDIEGNKARGQWYFLLAGTTKDNIAVWMGGSYDDQYEKINGRWFIKVVKPTFLFLTPYEDGWVKARFISMKR